ncbi:MAG: AtpZ/AtpI family protein [Candidatus Tenebribacter burtonii]|jgi:uncharacterized protein YneF (UPF0154 family)|nr:AtpZ/AtpI family protein [Candidatus Tenebribacter burtonii]
MWKKKSSLNSELLKYINLITQLGLTVVSSILIFLAGAIYLEKRFQTDGVLILVGVVLGVSVGIFAAYKLLKKTFKKE